MTNYSQYLRRFIDQYMLFFTQPLPDKEDQYNMGYCLAREDWKAIKQEINRYHLKEEFRKQLEEF